MTNLSLLLPESFLAVSGLILLLWSAFKGSARGAVLLTLFSFAVTAFLLARGETNGLAFGEMVIADAFGRFVKFLLLAASALSLALAPGLWRKGEGASQPDYAVLILFATLGMMLMVSAHDLIALYVGLEMQNLALYVLTAFRRTDPKASEAGVKYFTLGATSSCILLFGLSLVYGFAGGTGYDVIAAKLAGAEALPQGLSLGLAFAVAGLAFKIAAVPFHMWSPDVYEGARAPVSVFLAAVPKLAALALIARLLVQPFGPAAEVWRPWIVFLGVASMGVGAFAGLTQTNLKRLMAYSGIVNIGTLLVGLAAFRPEEGGTLGIEGMLLYMAVYVPGVLATFGLPCLLRRGAGEAADMPSYAGLSKIQPGLALAMGAGLFSLAGIPPFAGFFGKYLVLMAAVKVRMLPLAVFGVLASVVAAAYYLRLAKLLYFDPPGRAAVDRIPERVPQFVVVMSAFAATLFVLIPAPLMDAARHAAQSLMPP